MRRNLVTRRVGSLIVLRQRTSEPTDQDWNEFLSLLASQRREVDSKSLQILVYTDGGALSPEQRRRLAETLGDYHPKVACISNSVKVRFAGAMIALFQPFFRQFSVSEMNEAFAYLQLSEGQRSSAERILAELDQVLSA